MARRKNTKRIDPRYFLHETATRGEEEPKEPGVGGQPPEWERKLAKSEPEGSTARSKRRHVRGLEDPDVDVEELDEESTEELQPFKHKKGPMAAKRRWAIERARREKAGEPLGKYAVPWPGAPHKNEGAVRKGEEE